MRPGYPLTRNADTASRGAPARVAIYAECGGLMYLGTTLEVTSGERYTMADIIPGHSRMGTRLTRFGYCGSAGAAADAAGSPWRVAARP